MFKPVSARGSRWTVKRQAMCHAKPAVCGVLTGTFWEPVQPDAPRCGIVCQGTRTLVRQVFVAFCEGWRILMRRARDTLYSRHASTRLRSPGAGSKRGFFLDGQQRANEE